MIPMLQENWWLFVIALLLGIAIAWYIFVAGRRTSVATDRRDVLDEGAAKSARNQAFIDAAPAATRDVPVPPATPAGLAGVGEAVAAAVEDAQVSSSEGDDLTRIKGLGPKLAATLRELGITTFAQIAAWTEDDVDRIDAQLGRFEGRIRRDGWVEQSRLLADGDEAGFAAKYGAV